MRRSDQNAAQRGKPEISIIVPCYNVERFLRDCVASFELDKHLGVQVILVDDGSTDDTPEICDELATANACLTVIHRENGGSPSARNAGLAHADGNWVWFVDSDDLISPYAIDYLLKVSAGSDADVIQFGLQTFEEGSVPDWQNPEGADDLVCLSSNEWRARTYSGNGQHYACSFLFRNKEQWNNKEQAQGLFREEFSLFEDVVSIEELMQGSMTLLLSEAKLYGYRQLGTSMTHKRSNSAADSGLRAVLEVATLPNVGVKLEDKLNFETDLLFVAYGLTERDGKQAKAIRASISREIKQRMRKIGPKGMGIARALRYALMRTGALKWFYDFKNWGENA